MKHIAILFSLIVPGPAPATLARQNEPAPIININVSRSARSVANRASGGSTPIGFQGTALLPRSEGADARRRAEAEDRRKEEEEALIAEAQEQKAEAQGQQARAEAERARLVTDKAERDRQQLRAQLLKQFNRILATRDTDRGLVVTMADALFDTGKFSLRLAAREKLARLSGIVLAHPGLQLDVEGHADNVGSEEYNQLLSDKRAESVRSCLIEQKLSEEAVTARGFGETMPIADNSIPQGRQQNRRVEIIVSGEVIGARIGR